MNSDSRAETIDDILAVERHAPGMVRVVTLGRCYVVDARDGGCLCPDKQYHNPDMCKHEWAALLATDDSLPTPFFVADDLEMRHDPPFDVELESYQGNQRLTQFKA